MNSPATHLTFYGMSDTGLRRPYNEDHFVVADLTCKAFAAQDNKVVSPSPRQQVGRHGILLAVADGVGGYTGGELASQIAVEATAAALWTLLEAAPPSASLLEQTIVQAHMTIQQSHERHTKYPNMASTLTAIHITADGRLIVGQIGDSRAYLCRDGQLTVLTEDQTMVRYLQKTGVLSEPEVANHPYRNIILQALGQDHAVQPDVRTYPFQGGDRLLLCTDGLSSYVNPEQIEAIMLQEADAHTLCKQLIQAANSQGGPDNITVLLATLEVGLAP
jgi:protein phosphatase